MWKFLRQAASIALDLLIIPYIAGRIRTANDRRRAEIIEIIARGVVAEVVAAYPNSDLVSLIDMVVSRLGDALPPGVRTDNVAVLRRVAIEGLRAAGVKGSAPLES